MESSEATRISLTHKLEDMRRELENIQMENSVYEQYYEKKTAESEKEEPKSRAGSRQGGKSASKKSAPFKLNPHQKYEIANQVNDDVLKEIEDKKKNSERVVETLRAVLEETEIRIGELKRDAYEFKRDVVVGAENPRTGKIMSEKVTKYVDDRQAQRDVSMANGKLDVWWTDNGVYAWAVEQTKWCYKFSLKSQQRIVMRAPHLAGRIDNVAYEPLQHLRDPNPNDPYFADGGVSLRGTGANRNAVWM